MIKSFSITFLSVFLLFANDTYSQSTNSLNAPELNQLSQKDSKTDLRNKKVKPVKSKPTSHSIEETAGSSSLATLIYTPFEANFKGSKIVWTVEGISDLQMKY